MTEKEIDRDGLLIRRLAMDASAYEWQQEEELLKDVIFSPSLCYRRSMRAMLRDPLQWSRDRMRPAWQRVGRTVASILLAISILFAIIMAVSPTARAAVKQWFMEWYECYMEYRFIGKAVQEPLADYELGFIPEGYNKVTMLEEPFRKTVLYQNNEGKLLKFEYQVIKSGNSLLIWANGLNPTTVKIKDFPGEIFLSLDPSISNNLIWHNEELNLQFSIYGFVDEETLLAMAKSLLPQ